MMYFTFFLRHCEPKAWQSIYLYAFLNMDCHVATLLAMTI